ncbi:SPOR domain-containing protein [Solitalea koreensis]|uniref:Sporulation related domain-containing protein n=1 Tax=Solitalea koreensis TaxID=543615 RepID=A0A521CJM6_9SPHI|nr:SPOR domain-containing protein [Solitalea koreensis]SMO59669.1 Sporulation related domain-containing protein [Solitalea koreensis]
MMSKNLVVVFIFLFCLPILGLAQTVPSKKVKPADTTKKTTAPTKSTAPKTTTTTPNSKQPAKTVAPVEEETGSSGKAQIIPDTVNHNVEIVADPAIQQLITKRIEINRRPPEVGFRLQIYSGPKRNEAYSLQVKFALKYPELGSYLSYQAPNYKLRVGDFVSRADAEKIRKLLLQEFDVAFIVSDRLNQKKLYKEGETELP